MRDDSVSSSPPRVTARLADGLHALHRSRALPGPVRHEARRTWVNVTHTAVGAARHPVVDALVRAYRRDTGPAGPVLGRGERLDPHGCALAAGTAAHLDDFDDTHLATVIHPGAAGLGAALAAVGRARPGGPELLSAFALGVEAQLRLGVALTPAHYDEGWHITGTCGVVGAAVTAGLLVGLRPDGLARCIGLACSQTVGHREGFGSAVKPLNAGKAAANGVLAALLAEQEYTAPPHALEGRQGLFAALGPQGDPDDVDRALGDHWELLANTYKPYPCGIVSHPAIDAAVALSAAVEPHRIASARLRCHPLVVELTGAVDPATGLQAKFSTVHGVAAGLLDGAVGLPQYDDARVVDPGIAALRRRIALEPDPGCRRDEATLTVVLDDGTTRQHHVDHARGSAARPMTDEELSDKALALSRPVLGDGAARLLDAAWRIDEADAARDYLAAATPAEAA